MNSHTLVYSPLLVRLLNSWAIYGVLLMLFNQENYLQIKQACESKRDIEFIAPIGLTAFSPEEVPQEWTAYTPCVMTPQDYAQVFVKAGFDARGELTKLELKVQLDGGIIKYKSHEIDQVALKVTWLATSNT